jgi:hypothetical protein
MTEKLDPNLLALVESATTSERDQAVDVLVAIDRPADPDLLRELEARGLSIRSTIGTILTGSVKVSNIARVAEYPAVIKLEASVPMYRE